MNRLMLLAGIWLLIGAKPVIVRTDDGVIDWTHQALQVVGVGTPQILSPTGGLQPGDLYEAARDDAHARLGRLLGLIRVDGKRRVRELGHLTLTKSLESFTAKTPRRFTDGTIHLPAQLSFDWIVPALATTERPDAPTDTQGCLVLRVRGKLEPALQLTLHGPDGKTRLAGLPDDSLGRMGVRWVTHLRDAKDLLGKSPRTVRVTPAAGGAGHIQLPKKTEDLFTSDSGPGWIVVVIRP